jgi:hypothetical protein
MDVTSQVKEDVCEIWDHNARLKQCHVDLAFLRYWGCDVRALKSRHPKTLNIW